MKKLRVIISLTTNDNDYQMEQAAAAQATAQRLGIDLEVIHAENDAITQSQQLLNIIQSTVSPRPDGIVFEPVGATALPQVARAAAMAGMGWVVLNRDVDYLSELRTNYHVPAFVITSDHEEIGRIQGRQFGALLPKGGNVLYIQGPSESSAARQRTSGMYETKPAGVEVKTLRGQWTEPSAYKAVSSWLRLSTSREAQFDLIAAQDDSMARGARKAFQELTNPAEQQHWLHLPFIGCDGLPKTGQTWVRNGWLTATVVIPPNASLALEMLVQAIRTGTLPPERKLIGATSFPSIEALAGNRSGRAAGATGRNSG